MTVAITNNTPGMRDLVPELLGGRRRPSLPGHDRSTWYRPALLRSGSTTTFTVQGDWPENGNDYFNQGNNTYSPSPNNDVEYFVDGDSAYAAFCEAAETATGEGHFILILGWSCYHDFVLSQSRRAGSLAGKTLLDIVYDKARAGVDVRLLLYHQVVREGFRVTRNRWVAPVLDPVLDGVPLGRFRRWPSVEQWLREHANADAASVELTRDAILDLNLPNAKCELDTGHRLRASHHNKVWIVNGSEGLVAFYGGIDFNPDRLQRTAAGRPMHDVHARVRGPGAEALLEQVIVRWNFARIAFRTAFREWLANQVHYPPTPGRRIEDWSRFRVHSTTPRGSALVHACQTIGNPEIEAIESPPQRSDIWPEIRTAIRAARRFIYIEDQYFWSEDAARELGAALSRIAHLTVLIPPDRTGSGLNLRRKGLRALWEAAGSAENRRKIGIYERTGDDHSYIHAKILIFDDEYAMVGSANMNRRGYSHDGETGCGAVDRVRPLTQDTDSAQRWAARPGMTLAHKLRMSLWSEHLAFRGEVLQSRLWDGVAAGAYWRQAHFTPAPPPVIPGVLRNPARWFVPVPRGHVQELGIEGYPWWAWITERGPSDSLPQRLIDGHLMDPGIEEELDEGERDTRRGD